MALKIIQEKVETDGYYSFLHDWYIMELLESGWKPEKRGFPMYRYWDITQLGTDYFTETQIEWLNKRKKELLEQDRLDKQKVKDKIAKGELWYTSLDIMNKIIK